MIISVAVGHCKSQAGDVWITHQEAAKDFPPFPQPPSSAVFTGRRRKEKGKKKKREAFFFRVTDWGS